MGIIITTTVARFVVFAQRVRISTVGVVGVDNAHSLCSRYLRAPASAAAAAAKPAGKHPGDMRGEMHRLEQQGLRGGMGSFTAWQWLSRLLLQPSGRSNGNSQMNSMQLIPVA